MHLSSRITVFQVPQAGSPLARASTSRPLPSEHQPASLRSREPIFFREMSPHSANRSYKRAEEKDTRKYGPGKGPADTSGPLEQLVEAVVSPPDSRSDFGVDDQFLMISFGHWLADRMRHAASSDRRADVRLAFQAEKPGKSSRAPGHVPLVGLHSPCEGGLRVLGKRAYGARLFGLPVVSVSHRFPERGESHGDLHEL
jgi:hypothetical protein